MHMLHSLFYLTIAVHVSGNIIAHLQEQFSVLHETWILSTDFRRSSNIKCHGNLSSGKRVVPCGRTEVTNVYFRNSANVPNSAIVQS
jgi:hypothetical protein